MWKALEICKSLQKPPMSADDDDPAADHGSARELRTYQLAVARSQLADEERQVRRAALLTENRLKVTQCTKFQESGTLDLFPELVWKIILAKMEDPKEKAKLSNLSLMWRDALKRERTTFLFHAVFPLLHLGVYLKREEILRCRAVSWEWNHSIESHIQTCFDFKPPPLSVRYPLYDALIMDPFPLRFGPDETTMLRLITVGGERAPPFGNNGFFSRKIRFEWVLLDNMCWLLARHCLDRFGGEIYTLEIDLHHVGNNSARVYQLVRDLLSRVPNLKQFTLICYERLEDSNELRELMEETPLPEMPHLDYLHLQHVPPGMLRLMLNTYRPLLEKLYIAQERLMGGEIDLEFPKLKYFFSETSEQFSIPERDPPLRLEWPSIEEISVDWKIGEGSLVPKIFRSLNQVGKSLKKLSLTLQREGVSFYKQTPGEPLVMDAFQLKTLWLELPHVEQLSLTFNMESANLRRIDFILPMLSLKKLSVSYFNGYPARDRANPNKVKKKKGESRGQKDAGGVGSSARRRPNYAGAPVEIIKFSNLMWRLHDSNIWSLFPSLARVSISKTNSCKWPVDQEGYYRSSNQKSISGSREKRNQFNQSRPEGFEGSFLHELMERASAMLV